MAEFLIPVDTFVPSRSVAANGDATAPSKPAPKPLTKPLAPSYFAF